MLPDGSNIPDDKSPTGYLMSPVADLGPVAAAARKVGAEYLAMLNNPQAANGASLYLFASLALNVGQGGVFDYQRQGNPFTGFTQLSQFRNVADFNVGLFCQQVGLSLDETLRIAGIYAGVFSNNARRAQPYGLDTTTAGFIRIGYNIGATGIFDQAATP